VCCKVIEKLIRKSLLKHTIDNGFLYEYQHGFVKGRSCTTQLLNKMDLWTDKIDKGGTVNAMYLNFAKAFNTVPHQRLLIKLEGYGVKGKLLEWFKEKTESIVVAGSLSEWTQVLSEIPQGSVLGTVVCICYINDLPEDV